MSARTDCARAVSDVEHGEVVEGLGPSREFHADAVSDVEGTIDRDELGRPARARDGIPLGDQEKHW
jgi:hypothetical protein